MTSSLRHRRKEIEEQLSTELLKVERELIQATSESRREALQRYRESLDRFSRLVVHGEPPDASGAPLQNGYTAPPRLKPTSSRRNGNVMGVD
jgi:hypothetical protein